MMIRSKHSGGNNELTPSQRIKNKNNGPLWLNKQFKSFVQGCGFNLKDLDPLQPFPHKLLGEYLVAAQLRFLVVNLHPPVLSQIYVKGWLMEMYKKLCTQFYDLEPHRDGAAALKFYVQRAQQAQGPVLEPMCGTGRFLIPILQLGLDALGFDASADMLAAFKRNFARVSQAQAPVWQQFVQDFASDTRYKLIFVPYGSWGLITDIEVAKKSLEIMYHHLAPGGKFIVEIETIASVPQPCGILRRGVHTRPDGSKIAVNTIATYNESTQMFKAVCRYESIVNNVVVEVEDEAFYMYLYHFDEMDEQLRAVGFTDVKKYQNYDLDPAVDRNAHILIYECTK
jgi:SAM-dependent methyltransferase